MARLKEFLIDAYFVTVSLDVPLGKAREKFIRITIITTIVIFIFIVTIIIPTTNNSCKEVHSFSNWFLKRSGAIDRYSNPPINQLNQPINQF